MSTTPHVRRARITLTTPQKIVKIEALFQSGYSLDLISEMGLTYGWTRDDARAVCQDNDWVLAWDGRLPIEDQDDTAMALVGDLPYLVPDVVDVEEESGPGGDATRLIAAGLDHDMKSIRDRAKRAEEAVGRLRRAMVERERLDAQRAARERQAEMQRQAQRTDPNREFEHGTWSGYQTHKRTGISMCPACAAAGEDNMRRVRAAIDSARRSA